MKPTTLLAAALLLLPPLLLACTRTGSRGLRTSSPVSPAELAEAQEAFATVFEVLQHPRCRNCHPAGDRPLQFEGKPHAMNVVRGDDDRGAPGMRCAGCHGTTNHDVPHLPPGGAGWRLAPREMVFEGQSPRELAERLLDEKRSHMTPEELYEHVAHDDLVHWGWAPGPGRDPVPIPHETFVRSLRTWLDAGAPLPAEDS